MTFVVNCRWTTDELHGRRDARSRSRTAGMAGHRRTAVTDVACRLGGHSARIGGSIPDPGRHHRLQAASSAIRHDRRHRATMRWWENLTLDDSLSGVPKRDKMQRKAISYR